jgi:uncharacterized protein YkwD
MQTKLFLILGLFAALATSSIAQTDRSLKNSGPNTTSRLSSLEADLGRYLESDEDDIANGAARPRVVREKASAVKAAVIVNTVSLERNAFAMLNQKRASYGLLPLAWNAELAAVARVHSQNMAEFSFFSHKGLDGKMVSDRADATGVGKWRSIGENIAYNRGYQDPVSKAVELWLESPSHRHNLLDDNWKESAVGIAVAPDGSYYFTQVFLKK